MKEVFILAIGFGLGYAVKRLSSEKDNLKKENEALRKKSLDQ